MYSVGHDRQSYSQPQGSLILKGPNAHRGPWRWGHLLSRIIANQLHSDTSASGDNNLRHT